MNSPRHRASPLVRRTRIARSLAAALSALLVLPALAAARQAAPATSAASHPNLLAHGTGEMYWIAQFFPRREEDSPGEHTVIRSRQVGGDARWLEVGRVVARVVSIANRGTEVVALLESGGWMIIWPGGSSMGRAPADGARLVTLGSGPTSLWAIGVGARPRPATTTTRASTPAPDIQQSGATPAGPLGPGLYRFDRGEWVRRATLPPELNAPDRAITAMSIGVVGGEPVVAVRASPDEMVRLARWRDGRWQELGAIYAREAVQVQVVGGLDRPIVWVAPEQGGGALYFLGERGWSEPQPLEVEGASPSWPNRALASVGQNIRLVFARDDELLEQAFARDGSRIDAAVPLPGLPTSTEPTPLRWLTTAAAIMLMLVVFGSVRRGPPPEAVTGVTPAPLAMRFMAGMIDALPIAIAMVLLSREVNTPEPTVEQLMSAIGYPFYFSLLAYLLHTWLGEQLFGRTIGKLIFGLRVVTLDGERPKASAIFVRNALRLVDVMIIVPLVLVLFSPLRQRVGDIAARTVVVIEGASKPADRREREGEAED